MGFFFFFTLCSVKFLIAFIINRYVRSEAIGGGERGGNATYSSVVGAVHDGGHGKGEGDTELVGFAGCSRALGHFESWCVCVSSVAAGEGGFLISVVESYLNGSATTRDGHY